MKAVLILIYCFFSLTLSAQQAPEISYINEQRPVFSIATESEASEQLKLYKKTGEGIAKFPVLGDYTFSNNILSFQPQFPLSYNTGFALVTLDTTIAFQLSKNTLAKEITVTSVYPSTAEIPSNILTFYVEFEQPMIPDRQAYKYAKVINEKGEAVALPWREKSFWINDNKTLVLMVHPGRVKKGIKTTYDLAPIFVEGKKVTLRIEEGLRAAETKALAKAFEKSYETAGIDTISPKLDYCRFQSVVPETKEPLQIGFSEAMDFGLIYKWVKIRRDQNPIAGTFSSSDGQNWLFTPEKKWQNGNYEVSIANKVGDLCHNQQDRLFEISNETDFSYLNYTTFRFSLQEK